MSYLTNEDIRRLYKYLKVNNRELCADDCALIWGQKKSEPHYYTIPAEPKPVKVVFEDKSVIDDHVIQDWTIHLNDIKDIGIYTLHDESTNECVCESLL